ncbi:DUF6705 family protein [Psychroserpens sp.]|jgi:hypothetical protein|uniref:DUF6705 family protein n=1 Tax=Psychroserpens sp. TaxID=2020870 RepID=UPI0039E67679
MNNSYFTLLVILGAFVSSCKSQILPLDRRISTIVDDSYVKDTNNELDKFVGTWLFTNGSTSLIIKINKHEQIYNGDYYQDYLRGEYAYVENGIEVINTISLLEDPEVDSTTSDGLQNNINFNPITYQNIGGRYIVTDQDYGCDDCLDNERHWYVFHRSRT